MKKLKSLWEYGTICWWGEESEDHSSQGKSGCCETLGLLNDVWFIYILLELVGPQPDY